MRPWFAVVGLVTLGACVKNGMGEGVRTDVAARMESARPALVDCYHAALERDRKLHGQLVVAFRTAPSTGKFEQVDVVRDEVGDPALEECVKTAIATLALAAPTSTAVSITYPLDFAPTK